MTDQQLAYTAAAIARNRRALRRYETLYDGDIAQHEETARAHGSDKLLALREGTATQNRAAVRIYGLMLTPGITIMPVIDAGWPDIPAAPVDTPERYMHGVRPLLSSERDGDNFDALMAANYGYFLRTGMPHPRLDEFAQDYFAQCGEAARRPASPEARTWVREKIARKPAYGFWDVYGAGGETDYTPVDAVSLAFALDGKGIDYVLGDVSLSPRELAECADCAGLDMTRTQVCALVRLVLRQYDRDVAAAIMDARHQEHARHDGLRASLADAQSEIARLQAALDAQAADRQDAAARAELAERRAAQAQSDLAAVAADRQELAALRTALHDALDAASDAAPAPAPAAAELPDGLVIVGGTDPWRAAMSERLGEHATLLSPDQALRVDLSVLRGARAIYIQAGYMSHAAYNRVQAARSADAPPIRYFARVNADYCVAQILRDERR